MKFIFILYLLFVIGNRASAANYGEKPLVPGETDESDRDFPGWIYDYYAGRKVKIGNHTE